MRASLAANQANAFSSVGKAKRSENLLRMTLVDTKPQMETLEEGGVARKIGIK